MPTLTVRKLPQDVYDRLRIRAAENRRSMEAEARAVLAQAVESARSRDTASLAERASAWRSEPPAEQKAPDQKQAKQALYNLQKMMEKVKPKYGDSLVDEFLAERRAMWGEEE